MSTTTIIELWLFSSVIAFIFFLWMLFDAIADYGATGILSEHRIGDYGPESIYIARWNVIREAFRVSIQLIFLTAGYIAWASPFWAPDDLVLYLLLSANFLTTGKALFDRKVRIGLFRYIIPKAKDIADGSTES